MKKASVRLASLFATCIMIALFVGSFNILERTSVKAVPCTETNEYYEQNVIANDSLFTIPNGSSVNLPLVAFASNSSNPIGLPPTTVKTTYSLPSAGGNGTIAIIDAYDDPTIYNDTITFDNNFNLSGISLTKVEYVPSGYTISANVIGQGRFLLMCSGLMPWLRIQK
jgi:hypothetical protein